MAFTLGEIASAIGGEMTGDASLLVSRIDSLETAGAAAISVVLEPRFLQQASVSGAAALVIARTQQFARENLIRVDDPKHAFLTLLRLFDDVEPSSGIDALAVVAEDVSLGHDVEIGPGASLEEGVVVGDRVRIGANVVVGRGSVIGDDSRIHPNVTIYRRSVIGRRVAIHAGTVIGSDGFGYFDHADGTRERLPQLGIVSIEDDVEIGANCTIDRATLDRTVIGRGTKIDNLVQIGHNSVIGRDCCIVAQAGIAGSVRIGDGAVLAGQAGVSDHVTIASGVMVGAQAGVHADLHSGSWLGTPALPIERAGRVFAMLPHLSDYRDRVRALEDKLVAAGKRIALLEQRLDEAAAGPDPALGHAGETLDCS